MAVERYHAVTVATGWRWRCSSKDVLRAYASPPDKYFFFSLLFSKKVLSVLIFSQIFDYFNLTSVGLRLVFKAELKEGIGDFGSALATEDEHTISRHCHRKVAAGRGAFAFLDHFFPTSIITL